MGATIASQLAAKGQLDVLSEVKVVEAKVCQNYHEIVQTIDLDAEFEKYEDIAKEREDHYRAIAAWRAANDKLVDAEKRLNSDPGYIQNCNRRELIHSRFLKTQELPVPGTKDKTFKVPQLSKNDPVVLAFNKLQEEIDKAEAEAFDTLRAEIECLKPAYQAGKVNERKEQEPWNNLKNE